MQGWESEWDGVGWDPMGGNPWEPKGIPWEETHGRRNSWEPKGSHGKGSRTSYGRGSLGSPRDPMGGDPWGHLLGSKGPGPIWKYFPRIPQIVEIKDLTIKCDQICQARVPKSCAPFSAHFRLAKTPSIAIWGKIFLLGTVGWVGWVGWGGVGWGGVGWGGD